VRVNRPRRTRYDVGVSSFSATHVPAPTPRRVIPLRRVARCALVSVGLCFLALGAVGLLVPGWPTTVFWLLATFCFARSYPPLQRWIYCRGWVGRTVELVFEHRAITRRARVAASCGVALSFFASAA